jgi:general secretion pathway protein D
MPTERLVLNSRAFAAALAVSASMCSAGALAQAAGTASGLSDGKPANTPITGSTSRDVGGVVGEARDLYKQGKLIHARALLDELVRTNKIHDLSDEEQSAGLSLLREIDVKVRTSDPVEVSLQRAEYFLSIGELRQAERHANAVAARGNLTPTQEERAEKALGDIQARRNELTPLVPGLIEQAQADFAAERYASAKGAVLTVLRSGVELTAQQVQELEGYQLKILDIENSRGTAFNVAGEAGLASMQPGTVRKGNEPAGEPTPPEPEPEQPSEGVTLTGADVQEQPASPAPEPAGQPAPTPAPEQPNTSEVIQAAMRAEAQATLAQADQAFNAARYREAVEKYGLCTSSYRQYLSADEVARAERQMNEARARLDDQSSRGLGAAVEQNQSLVRQQVTAEFNNLMSQSQEALAAGDVTKARDLAARARIVATGGRSAFSEGENENFMRQVDEALVKIDERGRQIEAQTREQADRERAEKARMAEQNRATERERKINEGIDRIRALQAERKYDDALKVVDDVLFLDPNNPTALLLKDILRDIVIYSTFNQIQAEKAFGHAKLTLDAANATIPISGVIEFPDNWPEKTATRGEQSAYVDAPENRRILAQLQNTKMPVEFNGNRFADVVEFVRTITNVPLDVDWESLQTVGVDQDTQVNLKLSALPLNVLLDRIMGKVSQDPYQKAAWAVDQGILTIASDQALRQHRSLVIYQIDDLLLDIPNFREVPQIDLQSVLGQGQGGTGQSPFTGQGAQGTGADPRPTREERTQQIIDIIQDNVDRDGWRDRGGETGELQRLDSSLIITNTPKNHREIVGLLSKLREIRNMQINVETKFLLVNQNWFEQIGFDLDIVFNANNNQVRTARATDQFAQSGDFFDFSSDANGGRRGLQRQLPGRNAVDLNQDGDFNDPGEAATRGQNVVNPRGWSPVGGQQNSLGIVNSLVQGDFATGILNQAPALGIAGQFLDDIQVDFLVQATQADQRTVNLTAPRLTFTNGQTANIYVVTQQAFVSDLQPVTSDSAVGFDPTTSVASEGVTLLVEGVISADRRYVTLTVDAGVARIDDFAEQRVTAVAGGQLVNSADTGAFIQLPTVTVTRVRTTVTVPDEGTILLGGQRLITELEVESGVPVLSKIPILNRFFTNRVESKEEQTLLILLKPTVIIQNEQEERAYPGLSDSVRSGLNFLRQ